MSGLSNYAASTGKYQYKFNRTQTHRQRRFADSVAGILASWNDGILPERKFQICYFFTRSLNHIVLQHIVKGNIKCQCESGL